MTDARSAGLPGLVLWCALFVGLSPTLLDLARHWLAESWALPFAGFVPLWLLAVQSDRQPARPRPLGVWLLIGGLLLAAFAATSGSTRLGRYGVPAAVVGLALWLGTPALVRALIAVWWIPMPNVVQASLFAPLARVAEGIANRLAAWTGGEPLYAARQLLPAVDPVRIGPEDLGVQVCWLLAGVAWYAAARRGADVPRAAGLALRSALIGVPLQAMALAVASALALLGSSSAARAWLDLFLPLVAVCALAWLVHDRSKNRLPVTRLVGRRAEAR